VADLGKVADALKTRGYAPVDVEAILSGNWLRLLRRSLP
jgi:membrane dipeptidase